MFKGYRSCTRTNGRSQCVTTGKRRHQSWNISCRTQAYFKKENLTSKIRKDNTKKPYFYKEKKQEVPKDSETTETIKISEDIANLEPGKNAQLAAKKISGKYKNKREALAKKQKYKIPGKIVKIEEVGTPQGKVKVPVSVEKTAKKLIKKYDKFRRENKFKKIVDANEKIKKTEKIDVINEMKNYSAKKMHR